MVQFANIWFSFNSLFLLFSTQVYLKYSVGPWSRYTFLSRVFAKDCFLHVSAWSWWRDYFRSTSSPTHTLGAVRRTAYGRQVCCTCLVTVWLAKTADRTAGDAIASRSSRKGRARACRLVSVHWVLGERPSYPSTLCCRTYITVLCLSLLVVGASWRLMGDQKLRDRFRKWRVGGEGI